MVYNNYALYMLLYKQCLGFYCCSKRVYIVNARSVFQEHHLVTRFVVPCIYMVLVRRPKGTAVATCQHIAYMALGNV